VDWNTPIDIYCERLDASFWSEPLNALSNLAFILAALWGAYEARRRGIRRFELWLLIVLAFCIGIGSFLFHTFATGWAAAADVIPIVAFVLSYICVASLLLAGPSRVRVATIAGSVIALIILLGFGANWLASSSPGAIRVFERFNGSDQYLPALAAMIIFSVGALALRHPVRWWFTGATVVFIVSLTFRTVDAGLCEAWPHGTHIFWHLLNGATIALLLQALIRQTQRPLSP
jgi:hypothetical protein